MNKRWDIGSIELVVLGLLAALIVVLAIPLFTEIDVQEGSPPKMTHQAVQETSKAN